MINPIKLLKVYGLLNKGEAVVEEKASMNVKVPQLVTLFATLAGTIGLPTLVTNFVHAHLYVYMGFVAAALVLHALLPSLFAAPSQADLQASGLSPDSAASNVKKISVLLLVYLILPSLYAQTTTPAPPSAPSSPTPMFTGSSDAVAFRFNGEWTPATLAGQQFDFLDLGAKKTNHLSLVGNELIAPGEGFNAYLGGLRFEPDLSSFLAKTNVPAGTFGLYIEGSAGNGVPSSGGSHISFLAGGGVKYRATASLSWNALEAQYVRFGTQQGAILSSGLSFVFGSK